MRARWLFFSLVLSSICALGCTTERRSTGRERDGGSTAPSGDGSIADIDARITFRDAGFVACETTTEHASPLPTTLLFNLDMSGSMNCAVGTTSCGSTGPTPAPDDSRYDQLRIVLEEALTSLPDSTRVGIQRYPDGARCAEDGLVVELDTLDINRSLIDSTLRGMSPEANAITPTHDAVVNALTRLRARTRDEARFQVLATDGAATVCLGCDTGCSFDQQDLDNEMLIERVRGAAEEDGIRTFVIGVPGSRSFQQILSRMASAAGTARPGCSDEGPNFCHFDLTDSGLDFSAALRQALAAIGNAVLSCEYEIPPNPDGSFDPTRVNVALTDQEGESVQISRDPTRANGWDYSDDSSRIELHGDACTQARDAQGGRIDVLFGCPTILI